MGRLSNIEMERQQLPAIQYIIEDEETLQTSRFECEYRATRREEMTRLLLLNGCSEVTWLFPEDTGFYQPIVVAKKKAWRLKLIKKAPPDTSSSGGFTVYFKISSAASLKEQHTGTPASSSVSRL